MRLKLTAIAATMLIALAGCGGGGGGGGSAGTTTPPGVTTLALTAKLNGQAVGGFTVNAGESKVLGISTGDDVEIDASAPVIMLSSTAGAARADVSTNSSTVYRAKFTTTDHTTARYVFASVSDPSKTAAVTLTILGSSPNFNRVTPVVKDAFTYAENDVTVSNKQVQFPNITHTVTAVDTAGNWTEAFSNPGGTVLSNVRYNLNGNRTGYQATDADTSGGCKQAGFDPEEKLLAFPLSVGATYSGSWLTTCAPSDSQNEALTARVTALEKVTTGAGIFNALRIETSTVVTNSTDTRLPARGYTQTVTSWFDPILGRNIKYSGVRTYPANGAPTVPDQFISTTNIELVNAVKN